MVNVPDIEISYDALFFLLPAFFFIFLLYSLKQRFSSPRLFVSTISSFTGAKKSWREKLAPLTKGLYALSIISLMLAFLDVRLYFEWPPKPKQPGDNLSVEGIALYLVLDQSGSMKDSVVASDLKGTSRRMSKIELLKTFTSLFIQGDPALQLSGRPNDLIGLVEFARSAKVVVPLTLDHQAVLEALEALAPVAAINDDGTAIGYAIFKTANLIVATRNYAQDKLQGARPAYDIKSAVILLVTDGLQDPNPLDKGKRWRQIDPIEAAQYALDNNIRLYIVNVEPSLATAKFEANLNQMKKAAQLTGGQFFMANRALGLQKIYASINALEKSAVPLSQELKEELKSQVSKDQLPDLYQNVPLYPYFTGFAMLCLLSAIAVETTALRRYP